MPGRPTRRYVHRVTTSVMDMAEHELGARPPYGRVVAIVRELLDEAERPRTREAFAAWIFERRSEALK